jgi:tetratricopeptide (TPR) repeat protein
MIIIRYRFKNQKWVIKAMKTQLNPITKNPKGAAMKQFVIVLMSMVMSVSLATAAGSPSIKSKASKDVTIYNAGVALMMDKKFNKAEKQFRKSIALNERFAEAHNNLAYTLRKQGPEHYDEALKHYNRAIALKPGLNEPYMYRGVLYVQMSRKSLALEDHSILAARNSPLAEELQFVIENGREKEPEQFFGVSRGIDS